MIAEDQPHDCSEVYGCDECWYDSNDAGTDLEPDLPNHRDKYGSRRRCTCTSCHQPWQMRAARDRATSDAKQEVADLEVKVHELHGQLIEKIALLEAAKARVARANTTGGASGPP